MKEPEHHFPRRGGRLIAWPGRAGLFTLLLLGRVPHAQPSPQDVSPGQMIENPGLGELSPSPASVIPQTEAEKANPGEFQVFTPGAPAPDAFDQPFQWGKVIFRPHVTYRFFYGNGIQSAPGIQQKTIVQEFSPGILIDLGPDWVLDYTPTLRYYSSREFQDGVDQAVILRGGTLYKNWSFGLSQSFNSSTAPTVETGSQVDQDNYLTALSASCQLNDKFSVDLGANQNFLVAQALQSSREWSSLDWVNFKIWTRLNVGLGAGGGYDDLETGPNQTFEQGQGRINWRLTDQLSLSANGGVEDRQFEASGRPNLISPIYGGTLQYQPFAQTSIGLTANSAISQSFFQSQITELTSYGIEFNQRLLGRLHLDLNYVYNIEDYLSSVATVTSRTDDYYSFNARLSCPVLKRGSVGLTYEYSHNQSTAAGFTYGSTQIGFDINYTY